MGGARNEKLQLQTCVCLHFSPFLYFFLGRPAPLPPYETGELHVQLKELLVNSRRYTSLIIITKSNHVGNSFGCTVTESIMENIKIVNKI